MEGSLGINIFFVFFLVTIFVGWFRQNYGIDNYKDSAIGLAGAAILKTLIRYP